MAGKVFLTVKMFDYKACFSRIIKFLNIIHYEKVIYTRIIIS